MVNNGPALMLFTHRSESVSNSARRVTAPASEAALFTRKAPLDENEQPSRNAQMS
jgi:hypothetical protein